MSSPPKKGWRGGSRPGRPLTAWQRSAAFRAVALAALRKINTRRHLMVTCNATAKSTGQRCQQLPVRGSTKCRFHGGVTPRGDNWHRPRWPRPSDPKALEKIDRILRSQAKSAKERGARLATLSPAMRERYANWVRAHRPGPKAARLRERAHQRQNAEARELVRAAQTTARPVTPELAAIEREIDALRAELATATASVTSVDQPKSETPVPKSKLEELFS